VLKPGRIIALVYPMELNDIVPRIRSEASQEVPVQAVPLVLPYTPTLEDIGFIVLEHNVQKLIRTRPLSVRLIDSMNAIITTLSGAYGDRGFTIAGNK